MRNRGSLSDLVTVSYRRDESCCEPMRFPRIFIGAGAIDVHAEALQFTRGFRRYDSSRIGPGRRATSTPRIQRRNAVVLHLILGVAHSRPLRGGRTQAMPMPRSAAATAAPDDVPPAPVQASAAAAGSSPAGPNGASAMAAACIGWRTSHFCNRDQATGCPRVAGPSNAGCARVRPWVSSCRIDSGRCST
jgi:hypothetical protein